MGDDLKQMEAQMLLADFKKRQALLGLAKGDWRAWANPKSWRVIFFVLIFPLGMGYAYLSKPENYTFILYVLATIVYYQLIYFSVLENRIKALIELLDEKELLKTKI